MTLLTWNEIQAGTSSFPREYVLWTIHNSSSFHNLKRTAESSFMCMFWELSCSCPAVHGIQTCLFIFKRKSCYLSNRCTV